MVLKTHGGAASTIPTIGVRCPVCGHLGTFEGIGSDVAASAADGTGGFAAGHRKCPNPTCTAHLFVVLKDGSLVLSYPAERIDFDTANVPPAIVEAFAEALTCHAHGCFKASAMMVRKALEETCRERGAKGGSLYERIEALKTKATLPQELLDGLHEIRLLGNDAAHVDAQDYAEIGKDEIETIVEFSKELLKALYQYQDLLRRMRSLKKDDPSGSVSAS